MIPQPLGLICELTHRCPLRCLYCSNPLELSTKSEELEASDWARVIREAAALGILQIYLTGGEPCLRPDLEEIAAAARDLGLYVNLITSGVGLSQARCAALCAAGVEHIQLSLQDIDREGARKVSGIDALRKKMEVAGFIRASSAAMTVNIVVHRENLPRLSAMIDTAVEMGAAKIEIAHVQFNGWAIPNRHLLLPTEAQVHESIAQLKAAKEKYRGAARIDYVLPDYYAKVPKACMNGWAQKMILIDPKGRALPCHSAATIPGVELPSVRTTALAEIWRNSSLFNLFRGEDWMPEACRSCDRRFQDFGGCRCQALALTGDAHAADPVCQASPHRGLVDVAISGAFGGGEARPRPVTV